MKTLKFDISGMHCRSCELLTEEELLKVHGVDKAKTNFRTGVAEVSYKDMAPSLETLEEAVKNAGYKIGKSKHAWITRDASAWIEVLFAVGISFVLFIAAKLSGLFEISLGSSERLSSLPFVLLVGLVAGFSTCMAIIGGMVLAVSTRFSELHPETTMHQKFLPHLYFNLGRIGGFSLLGGLLGLLGSTVQLSSFSVGVLTLLVGVVMLLLGVQLLELFPRLSAWKLMLPKGIAKMLGIQAHTKRQYSHSRAMFVGAGTFFLPCGFTQLTQLFVVTQGSPLVGALTMGTFALGTAPGLLGIGGAAAVAAGSFRQLFFKTAGIIVFALGVFNMQNGFALVALGPDRQNGNDDTKDAALIYDTQEEAQVIRITQKADGYFPSQVTVKQGRPVRLILDSQESYSCAVSLSIPKLGIRKVLKPGENVFEFMPDKTGQIPFSCSMGMYRGVINVID